MGQLASTVTCIYEISIKSEQIYFKSVKYATEANLSHKNIMQNLQEKIIRVKAVYMGYSYQAQLAEYTVLLHVAFGPSLYKYNIFFTD